MKSYLTDVPEDRGATVRVWDRLVRIFHWSLAICLIGACLLGEGGGKLHQTLGYTVPGLIGFRLLWGVLGTRYAHFGSFIPSFGCLTRYLKDGAARRAARYVGITLPALR